MASELDKLLEKIDPQKIHDKVEYNINNAVSFYDLRQNTVDSYDEFKSCLSDFVRKLWGAELKAAEAFESASEGMMLGYAIDFLKAEYPYNTEKIVYEIMNTGAEGGVYHILKTLGKLMIDKLSKSYVEYHVEQFLRDKNFDAKKEVANEYVSKFSDMLPQNYKDDPIDILINLQRVLEEHPQLIRRYRNLR